MNLPVLVGRLDCLWSACQPNQTPSHKPQFSGPCQLGGGFWIWVYISAPLVCKSFGPWSFCFSCWHRSIGWRCSCFCGIEWCRCVVRPSRKKLFCIVYTIDSISFFGTSHCIFPRTEGAVAWVSLADSTECFLERVLTNRGFCPLYSRRWIVVASTF